MGSFDADLLINALGASPEDVQKAIKHFGDRIQTDTAADWIFSGCPGYNDGSSTQVVPYAGPQMQHDAAQPPRDNSGWEHAYREHDQRAANAMLALKDNGPHSQWEITPEEQSRPYAPISPLVESVDMGDGRGRTSAPRSSPVEMLSGDNGAGPGAADDDDELKKAIQLSLQDSQPRGTESAAMSRGSSNSKSRQQQKEEDELAQALSQSMYDVDQRASTSQAFEKDPLDTMTRDDLSKPIVLSTPSSFLAYLPPMLQSFYHNPAFRNAIIQARFEYRSPPSYSQYHTTGATLTRDLLLPNAPDFMVKIAALQRLFVYMSQTKRSKAGLKDIMDAFSIQVPNGMRMRSPLDDMRSFHVNVCQAFEQYIPTFFEHLGTTGQVSTQEAATAFHRAHQILHSQGIVLPQVTDEILENEPDPALFNDSNNVHWTAKVDLTSYSPEMNETGRVLDAYFENNDAPAFILKPGESLYTFNAIVPRPNLPESLLTTNAPSSDDHSEPFRIEPRLYLDKYMWANRKKTVMLWRRLKATKAQLLALGQQRDKLTINASGKPLIAVPERSGDSVDNASSPPAEPRGLLQQSVKRLEELQQSGDEQVQKDRTTLIERLHRIIALLQSQVDKLTQSMSELQEQLQKDNKWEGESVHLTELRTSIVWNGHMGKDSVYIHVRSGTTSVTIGDETVKQHRWWKVADTGVTEVSLDAVCNDRTGMHMPNAGNIAQSYALPQPEEDEERSRAYIPAYLEQPMAVHNSIFTGGANTASSVAHETTMNAPTPASLPAYTPGPASEHVVEVTPATDVPTGTDLPPPASHDVVMQTDEVNDQAQPVEAMIADDPAPLAAVPAPDEPLNLRGGASRRRASVSSDTGSIASTSKVRLDDLENDDDASVGEGETVELGFPVKMKKAFKVVRDVGKIGGKPTWLNPALPLKSEMTTCETCKAQMQFLLQMNCPLDDMPQAIYRTFYVYTCRQASCLKASTSKGVRVFRTQLPSINPYYEVEDEAARSKIQKFKDKQYSRFCANCKMEHPEACDSKPWNEWLIETDSEELEEGEDASPEDLESRMNAATLRNEDASADVNEPDTRTGVDAAFLKFQERLYNEPDQILRYYYRDSASSVDPLWVSDGGKPRQDAIGKCECGAERQCEFQIMPPILSILGVNDLDKDSLDFGTIIVYTCKDACTSSEPPKDSQLEAEYEQFSPGHGWQSEVAFVQNFSTQGVRFRG